MAQAVEAAKLAFLCGYVRSGSMVHITDTLLLQGIWR